MSSKNTLVSAILRAMLKGFSRRSQRTCPQRNLPQALPNRNKKWRSVGSDVWVGDLSGRYVV